MTPVLAGRGTRKTEVALNSLSRSTKHHGTDIYHYDSMHICTVTQFKDVCEPD